MQYMTKKERQKIIKDIKSKKAAEWSSLEKRTSNKLLKEVPAYVPAYRKFLKKRKSIHLKRGLPSLSDAPISNKNNYLRAHPYNDLFKNGKENSRITFTSTSGSTGEPFYFGRGAHLDHQASLIHEYFYNNGTFNTSKPTLVIVCFGMGVWIGGLITYKAFEIIAEDGYPISIITPGINKDEIFRILKKLAPHFEQIILAGYPPFLKDIIDEASVRGIKFKKWKIKLLFAAEHFTESFRDYVAKNTGIKNCFLDTMNIYGAADIGAMAFESPLSTYVRRKAVKNKRIFKKLFPKAKERTPTLAQYIPSFISFTEESGNLLLTGDSAMPLVKYAIGDSGGVLSYTDIETIFREGGISLKKELKAHHIPQNELPFVYVYERTDFSTTLYGLQIYPETIREVLIEKPFNKIITGKCSMITKFDGNQNQFVEINIELRKSQEIGKIMQTQLRDHIVHNLREKNSEFRELSDFLKERAHPRLRFWPAEDPTHFKLGIKQKWTKK